MKKIITLSAIAFLSTALYANADIQTQLDELNAKIAKLEKVNASQSKRISAVNKLANKDNLKFDVDFRTSYDKLNYDMVSGNSYENKGLFANRLWLGMGYAPTDTMLFKGQLSFNKAFGASYGQRATGMGFDTFDWVVNENLADETLRVREAYWLWTPKTDNLGFTVSVGRRPATNGYLINLRDDDKAKSPMGHIINMEFDGGSASIQLDKYVPGMYAKLCVGRGLTNATGWASQATNAVGAPIGGSTQPNYTTDPSNLDNTDMVGVIFKPYDDGQYSVMTKYYRGFNVPGLVATNINNMQNINNGPMLPDPSSMVMATTGDMDGAAISAKIEGIGDEINDFLDETILFASYAMSKSNPNSDISKTITTPDGLGGAAVSNVTMSSMLGSTESETGTSYWVGIQTPNLTGGKFGLEYNHGDKYWRPFTYGEDTLVGSKMAVRGSAYEAYWTQPLGKAFSMQVRYTYLDYDYTGSDGFFGDGGTPMSMEEVKQVNQYLTSIGEDTMDAVETASDIRVYFRYKY